MSAQWHAGKIGGAYPIVASSLRWITGARAGGTSGTTARSAGAGFTTWADITCCADPSNGARPAHRSQAIAASVRNLAIYRARVTTVECTTPPPSYVTMPTVIADPGSQTLCVPQRPAATIVLDRAVV